MTLASVASTSRGRDIQAAGVVAFRPGREVLLIHRPKYDDWSFPKGKLERGEHPTAAAVRETAEETGVHVRLGPPLPGQRYPTSKGMKSVHYWTARPVGNDDVSLYRPNAEVDQVAWVPIDRAAEQLTHPHDRETLAAAAKVRRKTRPVLVLRHAKARSRRAWRGEDHLRPLLKPGEVEADRLVPLLAAYDVSRVVSSTSVRCTQTVAPYVETTGWELEAHRRLSEEQATAKTVSRLVADLLDDDRSSVVCTHRPVLPLVFDALDLEDPSPPLEVAELAVVHVRKGAVVAVERHRAG